MLGAALGFLAAVYVITRLIYYLVIDRAVPGSWDRRYRSFEPLPEDVGKWKGDDESDAGRAAVAQGLRRETRVFHDPNSPSKVIHQARYRNAATNAIIRVEPDLVAPRRRARG